MDRRFATLLAGFVLTLSVPVAVRAQTLARLSHESTPDLTRIAPPSSPYQAPIIRNLPLRDSALSRQAALALFTDSNVARARQLSAEALRRNPQDAEALFLRMEIAGMNGDLARVLQFAVRLCELGAGAPGDSRVRLAAARIRELAANTPPFRNAIPPLQALLTKSREPWPDLQEALLNAAMDGAPALDPYALSRSSGILTDWRMVGPLGSHPLLDQQPVAANDGLARDSYQNRRVENFQFPDGRIVLPDYMSRHGVFYAATGFSSLAAGRFTVRIASAGAAEIYADGQRVLRADSRGLASADLDLPAGPHRILLKFIGSSAPLRISINAMDEPPQAVLPKKISLREMTYLLAAEDYAAADFGTAIHQIAGVRQIEAGVALQFLLSQAATRSSGSTNASTMWDEPVAGPPADEAKDVAQRIAGHPSCHTLLAAIGFYHQRGEVADARSAQQKLDGCAPESLDYARSLAEEGDHAASARALQRLLLAAPLNRPAREMLIRELQLSGDDEQAQHAAAQWLRIAPNAENYHRLAAESSAPADEPQSTPTVAAQKEFYQPYRRDAYVIARQSATASFSADTVQLLDDHIAIVRPDGSVSLYVHSARRALTLQGATQVANATVPLGAQVLTSRILHPNGSSTGIADSVPVLAAGDIVDEEYILHFAGDGGIPEHPEVFQFVFGSFNQLVLHARFVVLTPASRADHGVVIATGDYPAMTVRRRNGMLERVWQEDVPDSPNTLGGSGTVLGIVRLVEQENGWTVPSSAEHRRRIETIHPGPRPEDS
jgi:hypothetical protein